MLMTSCFVCATLNLGRKKSTGTEPMNMEICPKYCIYRITSFSALVLLYCYAMTSSYNCRYVLCIHVH